MNNSDYKSDPNELTGLWLTKKEGCLTFVVTDSVYDKLQKLKPGQRIFFNTQKQTGRGPAAKLRIAEERQEAAKSESDDL